MRRSIVFLAVGVATLGLGVACGGGGEGIPIFFQSDRDGQWEIYSVSHDGVTLKRLTNDPADDTYPEASMDGTKVVFIRTAGGVTDIWTMNADGTGQRNLTGGNADGQVSAVSWYKGATQIILAMATPNVAGGRSQIYSIKADGSGLTRVSKDDTLAYLAPRVHPEGGQLMAAAGTSPESLDIHVLTLTGDFTRIVPRETFRALERGFDSPGISETTPDFDPTGRTLVFQTNIAGRWQIFRVEGDGRKPTNLTDEKAAWNETEPSWSGSLDRLWYAYVSDQDGNPEVYIAKMGSTERKRLTNNPAKDTHPTWIKSVPLKK